MSRKADFGFKQVAEEQKQSLVQGVFSSVAHKYDLMNDLMSFGMHRWWKRELLKEITPCADQALLDVAGGTGDIAHMFLNAGGKSATVADLNNAMLASGKKRYPKGIKWVHANAETLPFKAHQFDYYTISFGIRNVTYIDKALKEAYRVLKPGGKFVCLEFSNVNNAVVRKLYDWYSFNAIPKIGKMIADDEDAYRYLVESIRRFPKATRFEHMIKQAGFNFTEFRKLTFGVVAIHIGYK